MFKVLYMHYLIYCHNNIISRYYFFYFSDEVKDLYIKNILVVQIAT